MVDGWITADTLVHERALARSLMDRKTSSHIQTWGGTHSCVMIDLNYGRRIFMKGKI